MNTPKPFVIGITGTIGSGKSAVGSILEEMGIPVIDTDKVVHELFEDETPVKRAVIERFGKTILDMSGQNIDRKKLGEIIFADEGGRKDLESIVHPAVILDTRRRVALNTDKELVAVLSPLLFEANVQDEYDQVWAIIASEAVLRERLSRRDNLSAELITQRLRAQFSQEKKASLANVTIDNSGTKEETKRQVEVNLDKLRAVIR
ncbi:MAG: dephospho-CoA kinase [Leptolyngbya sp.]|nr:dephospho-CoA kinase [Candidatus Melainabacteria bacterium]